MEPGALEGMFLALMVGDYNEEDADPHGTTLERPRAFTEGFVNPNACFIDVGLEP